MLPYPNRVIAYRINGSCSETTWTATGTWPAFAHGEVETMDDYVTPRFKELQAMGKVAFNPMSSSRTKMTFTDEGYGQENERQTPFGCIATSAKQRGKFDGPAVHVYFSPFNYPQYPQTWSFADLTDSDEILDARDEITTKVLADRGKDDSNLWESIAEYRQTLDMFRGGLNRYWRWISKNENFLKNTTPAGAWLAYRYGVMPFVNDVRSILKGLGKLVGKRRKTTRSRIEINKSKSTSVDTGATYGTYKVHLSQQTTERIELRAMSLDEYIADVQSNIGLSVKGFLTVPWELIPYSFVADWFLNVGDFINALAPAPGWNQLGSAITVKKSQINVVTITGLTVLDANYVNIRMPKGEFQHLRESKTRGTLGLPRIVVKNDFRLNSATRLADSIALSVQKMSTILAGKR